MGNMGKEICCFCEGTGCKGVHIRFHQVREKSMLSTQVCQADVKMHQIVCVTCISVALGNLV